MTGLESEMTWRNFAKGLLKSEMKRRDMTYRDLAEKLRMIGVDDTESNLMTKINRGRFSAPFFLQALDAIGCRVIRLSDD